MAVDYLCKACRGHLNVKTSIVLSASKMNSSQRGLVYLDPELGNYTKTTHPSFQMEKGSEYLINCPICHSQLNSMKYPHLVRIVMIALKISLSEIIFLIDENGKEYDIYFSGIVGENCTYKISETGVEKSGPDANLYGKYFDVPDEDRKYL